MRYPALKQQSSGLEGLPAPQFSQPVPRSLLDQPSGEGISTDDPSGCQKQVQYGQDSVRPQQPGMHVPQMPMFRKSQRASELTRVRRRRQTENQTVMVDSFKMIDQSASVGPVGPVGQGIPFDPFVR